MKNILIVLLLATNLTNYQAQAPDLSANTTPTYAELIQLYKNYDLQSDIASLVTFGKTDSGHPLHLMIINKDKVFDPQKFKDNKVVFFINNGIHPGEPCGINASLHIVQEMAIEKKIPDNVILAIIPAYNIGGMINRGAHSRANQNGPEEYGFRGNAQNYDLNRDFIKADTKNASSFFQIFQSLQPHIFLDTHTSNGADYSYTMTLITSQADMAGPIVGDYSKNIMTPALMEMMAAKDWPMFPYVNSIKDTPDKGVSDFEDSPRYSTGYTSLFNCLSFISETHMLKPFPDRVKSTYELIRSITTFANSNAESIIAIKSSADKLASTQNTFPILWQLDTTKYDRITFNGYESSYTQSKVTVGERLKYDRTKPFSKEIQYFNRFIPTKSIKAPDHYIIPASNSEVIDLLNANKIEMTRLEKDTLMKVMAYIIEEYKTREKPYEGHYLHYDTKVKKRRAKVPFKKGDYLIPCQQASNKFILATLEPEATDSYFNWNFFDIILQQKEWYSPYVFEDKAEIMLRDDPELGYAFEEKMNADPVFAKNPQQQLYWLYQHSINFESEFMRYPIFMSID